MEEDYTQTYNYCPVNLNPKIEYDEEKKETILYLDEHMRKCIGIGNYTNSIKNGEWIYYYPNEIVVLAKGQYLNGSRSGSWFFFKEDGSVNREAKYINSK